MTKLRTTASAYLLNNGDYLLMKRSQSRNLNPGTWANVGGHLEPDEINDPRAACLREIFEETGIREQDIVDFRLKYIIIRKDSDKMGIQFIFFGKSNTRQLLQTDEGELYWIKEEEMFNRKLDISATSVLRHYLEAGDSEDSVLVGILGIQDGKPSMAWNSVYDWSK